MQTIEQRQQASRRFPRLPSLVPRTVRRPNATALHGAAVRLARRVRSRKSDERLEISIETEKPSLSWTMTIAAGKSAVTRGSITRPDLKLIMRIEDAWSMLRGELAPGEAFLRGRILVIGDCDLARWLYRQVAREA